MTTPSQRAMRQGRYWIQPCWRVDLSVSPCVLQQPAPKVTLHINDHQCISFIARHYTRTIWPIDLIQVHRASSVSHNEAVHICSCLHSTILISNLTWNRFQLPGLAFSAKMMCEECEGWLELARKDGLTTQQSGIAKHGSTEFCRTPVVWCLGSDYFEKDGSAFWPILDIPPYTRIAMRHTR